MSARKHGILIWMALVFLVSVGSLAAQETASVPSADVNEYLGDWTLSMELQGNPVEMTLRVQDVDGTAAATIASARSPEPQAISGVSSSDAGLKLEWQRDFGGQTMNLAMELLADGDRLTGTFGDEGGFFSTDVEGSRGVATADDGDGDGDDDGQSRRRRRPRTTGTTSVALGGGEIGVTYPLLKQESDDFARLGALDEDDIFTFVGGATIKLKTEPSLKFGDVVVETHNVAETYPGVYALWLKKTGDGWSLVFNEHADVWGTQHFDDGDVVEVAIAMSEADEETDTLRVELIEVGDRAGMVRLAWGPHQWIAPFELAE